ncbi:MAG: P-loop NTPase fold protein [Snowella sp.]|nr:P-loop NTPase fold protein [Snowella sp.]
MTTTLRAKFLEASNNLKLFPLLKTEELEKFGVIYDTETLLDLRQRIEDGPNNSKIILSGHTGCGKSTLLARLAHNECRDNFFVTFFSLAEAIENSDVNYINILFAIGLKLLEKADKEGLDFPGSIKTDLISWFAKKVTTQTAEFKAEAGVGANLLEWLILKLKVDAGFRHEIKQEYAPKVSELVAKINEIAAIINTVTDKRILVIIDDIDKLDRNIILETFHGNIKSLFLPNFCVIYTLPIWALRDGEVLPTLQSETSDQIVSMRVMKLYAKGETRKPDPKPEDKAIKTFREILRLRLDRESYLNNPDSESELIDEEAIEKAILYSGGVLRELIRIANECCRICLRILLQEPEKVIKIDLDVLEIAVNNLRIQMARPLGKKRYEILQQVYQTYAPDDSEDPDFLVLLKLLGIIEYRNYREWYDVHPILVDLVQEWERNHASS